MEQTTQFAPVYTIKGRVRYSEIDVSGKLSLVSLLNYFQDTSTFQSEDIGLGYEYLMTKRLVWVLSAWQIVACGYPRLCEEIVVGTAAYGFRAVNGYRNFWLDSASGERLAVANSIWTLLDLEKGFPARPTQELIDGYKMAEKLPMDYADRKIAYAGDAVSASSLVIHPHHLDTNLHVNNSQYVRLAMDVLTSLADDDAAGEKNMREIHSLRVEYKKAALLGDILYPAVYRDQGKETIVLADEAKTPYCIVEFGYEPASLSAQGQTVKADDN